MLLERERLYLSQRNGMALASICVRDGEESTPCLWSNLLYL